MSAADRIDWREEALCGRMETAGLIDHDDWFRLDANYPAGKAHVARLRAICGNCPVLNECRAYAIDVDPDPWGMLGGLTPREIRKLRRGELGAA